ncbi:MAG: NAD(P)H-dependent oxidoreductase subunit E [Campylobacter hyointestinalis]
MIKELLFFQLFGWCNAKIDLDVKYLEKTLGIRAIFFKEAISFFAMLNDKPKGKFELKFCRTISCKLRGSDELIELCESLLGIKLGETTKDGLFSLEETECLGYCEKAPCMLCNLEQIDTLDEDKVANLIENLRTKECK